MDIWMDVDVALSGVPVNLMPLIDDTDFKTVEDAVVYNAAGMDLRWNFITCDGTYTSTAVTPTTAGTYDWTHKGDGMYSLEIPASGGASINNDTEGFGWFSGRITGVLPFRGPVIGFRAAGLNDLLVEGAYSVTRGLTGTALPAIASGSAGAVVIEGTGTAALSVSAGKVLLQATQTGVTIPTVTTVNTLTTYTGNTPQTGDAYARLGAPAGASTAVDIAAIHAKTTNLPAAPASTTNITGGTITTVTNLTNAPTSGDFTATMKTSIGTAVAASAVASVTAPVTVGTNNDKTGYSLVQVFPTNFADLAITATTGRVTTGTVIDKTGYSISGTTTTLDALQTALNSTHGGGSWATATGFATPTNVTDTQTAIIAHGDSDWITATGFATPTNVTTSEAAIIAHGDSDWSTATGFATPSDVTNSANALAAYGDIHWVTATGFATPSNVTTSTSTITAAITALQTHGDTTWSTADLSGLPTAAENADEVRTELAVELARIDVAVSTRLATGSYTSPPSAATISTQVASDLQTAHGAGSWTTATGFATPANVTTSTSTITTALSTLQTHGDTTWATATGFSTLDAADIRTAIGMASADLDDQLSEIGTLVASIDTAVSSISTTTTNTYGIVSHVTYGNAALRTAINGIGGGGGGGDATLANQVIIIDKLDEIITDVAGIGGATGPGASPTTFRFFLTDGVTPLADADVWITSTPTGPTIAGTLQTNSQGYVTFLLDSGQTYYYWVQKDGVQSAQGVLFTAE